MSLSAKLCTSSQKLLHVILQIYNFLFSAYIIACNSYHLVTTYLCAGYVNCIVSDVYNSQYMHTMGVHTTSESTSNQIETSSGSGLSQPVYAHYGRTPRRTHTTSESTSNQIETSSGSGLSQPVYAHYGRTPRRTHTTSESTSNQIETSSGVSQYMHTMSQRSICTLWAYTKTHTHD